MPTVVPCIKGRMGNTDYFEATVAARELVTGVRPASELDEWSQMGIEERMQRDPNIKRIMEEIAPYIARTPDRFFGAIIVLIYKGKVQFEGLKDLKLSVPNAYKAVAERMGFLTIDGGTLIVLDGQHRLLALEKVVKNDVIGPEANAVPNDDVCVIFIEHKDNQKTRRIFNKVNRYAKPTSRGDNIITSEDDAYAIVTRQLLNKDNALGGSVGADSIVNWRSNTLAPKSTQLTTISAVYEITKAILAAEGSAAIDPKFRPSDIDLEHYLELVNQFWEKVLSGVPAYRLALKDPSKLPSLREESAKTALLFKPAAQIAIFTALAAATERKASMDALLANVSKVNWSMKADTWRDIIVRPNGAIDAGGKAIHLASRLVLWLIAPNVLSPDEVKTLSTDYNVARGYKPGEKPEDLPTPVVPFRAKKGAGKKI